jgi:hypothetical protein
MRLEQAGRFSRTAADELSGHEDGRLPEFVGLTGDRSN